MVESNTVETIVMRCREKGWGAGLYMHLLRTKFDEGNVQSTNNLRRSWILEDKNSLQYCTVQGQYKMKLGVWCFIMNSSFRIEWKRRLVFFLYSFYSSHRIMQEWSVSGRNSDSVIQDPCFWRVVAHPVSNKGGFPGMPSSH